MKRFQLVTLRGAIAGLIATAFLNVMAPTRCLSRGADSGVSQNKISRRRHSHRNGF